MLDLDLKEQLKSVFSSLEKPVELVYDESSHASQAELVSMLKEIASTNPLILAQPSGKTSATPLFRIVRSGKPTGIKFRGIPGGHEFTSLVLAILNADGKGKMPDAGIRSRIQNLKGPIRIKTFISLTCENCPDVVQAFHQMALIHDDFEHEMIDGAFAEAEVASYGIQGVPAVVAANRDPANLSDFKMLHSGRIHFLDLLAKLEAFYGVQSKAQPNTESSLGHFEVAVLGGGPAGASAAIYSARKGLSTALFAERMGGQVKDTKGIENLVSVLYTEGPELAEQLHKHVASYPVKIFEQRRIEKITVLNGGAQKKVFLEGGETFLANALIIATGAKWRELGVPGEKEYLGRGVAYCPHCDGPFYKGKKIAVVGGGNSGVEAAIDLAGIAGSVTLIEYGEHLKADQILIDKLHSLKNTSVITSAKTTELLGDQQKIVGLRYVDRKTEKEVSLEIDGVFIQIGLLPNSGFAKGLLDMTPFGEIVVDTKGHTNVPGIYAAGDVTTAPFKQIIIAMGEGAKVALTAFEDRMYA